MKPGLDDRNGGSYPDCQLARSYPSAYLRTKSSASRDGNRRSAACTIRWRSSLNNQASGVGQESVSLGAL